MLEIEISAGIKLLLIAVGGILSLHRISSIIVISKARGMEKFNRRLGRLEGVCEERGKNCGIKSQAENN